MEGKLDDISEQIENLEKQGKIRDIAPLLEQRAEGIRIESGENSGKYAAVLNELGGLYRAIGDYKKAEAPFLKARDILEATTGGNHPDYATTLTCLWRRIISTILLC